MGHCRALAARPARFLLLQRPHRQGLKRDAQKFTESFDFPSDKTALFGTKYVVGANTVKACATLGSHQKNMFLEYESPFSCRDARRLMAFMSNDDPTISREEREGFEQHIRACQSCAAEYEEDKQLTALLKQYWPIKKTHECLCACGRPYRPMTVEEGWEDLKRRCPSLAEACRRDDRKKNLRRVIWRIGSMGAAACIVMAVGVWFMMHRDDTGHSQPPIAANNGLPTAFAELVTSQGRKPLGLNQPIATGAQPQEIWLSDMHRVVMNSHTKATFTLESRRPEGPYAGKVPYQIQLAQGELFVEVEPGNPFTVKTANARLDITGTKFDVLTDGEKTDLTLLKGSVRFSTLDHPHEAVSVTAGHVSTIVDRLAPTAPSPKNALATTAWAREAVLQNVLASDQNEYADDISASIRREEMWRQPSLPDVDTLDYEKWRDEHRHSRLALTALAALPKDKAVSADWIEVLMVSGNIWQFHYDPRLPGQPLTRPQPRAITRLARHYGIDEKGILKALGLGLSDSAFTATMSVRDGALGQQYAAALRRWHDAILVADTQSNPKAKDGVKTFTFDASQYLGDTRIAAYLWVKNHPEEARQFLADKEYLAMLPTPPAMARDGATDVDIWLKQLREEATAARNCFPAVIEWLTAPLPGCAQSSGQRRWLADLVAELTLPQEDKE